MLMNIIKDIIISLKTFTKTWRNIESPIKLREKKNREEIYPKKSSEEFAIKCEKTRATFGIACIRSAKPPLSSFFFFPPEQPFLPAFLEKKKKRALDFRSQEYSAEVGERGGESGQWSGGRDEKDAPFFSAAGNSIKLQDQSRDLANITYLIKARNGGRNWN